MSASFPNIPLVGREHELALLHRALDEAGAARGSTLILRGESGVGKSRLAAAAADEANRREWSLARGRAFPVETGMPYAPISDAMLALLTRMTPESLAVLTRGRTAELGHIFPVLRDPADPPPSPVGDAAEFKTRLLWNFSQLLGQMAERQPLLIILEDLHWADVSSIELLHFVARQIAEQRIAIVCTVNDDHREKNATLLATEQSLVAIDAALVHPVERLSPEDTGELICRTFDVAPAVAGEFIMLVYRWTRGNPFFLEETLKTLVQSGRLYRREGSWLGWEVHELELPRSIRDVLLARIGRLSPGARELAGLQAVLGTAVSYRMLLALWGRPDAELVAALDELRRERILKEEEVGGGTLSYDFEHQLLRETVLNELGLARIRLLHGELAESLEAFYGKAAGDHPDELAFHYARASATHLAPKAARYLAAAGQRALGRFSYREAADYLSAALEQIDGAGLAAEVGADEAGAAAAGAVGDPATLEEASAVESLARARQRLGEYEAAIELWQRARGVAEEAGDSVAIARVERRLGLAFRWSGRPADSLVHFEAGLAAAEASGPAAGALRARLKLARAECLQELGRGAEARDEIEEALKIAEEEGDETLLARAHFSLLLLHTWIGPPEVARDYGRRGIELAKAIGDVGLRCTLHWGMAVLEGLTGEGEATAHHIAECRRLAIELNSPLHRLWIAEIAIEYGAGRGDWDDTIALAERTIAMARAFNQRTLLPRLLVWTALIYCGRGDLERAKSYIDEAWELSGAADASGDAPFDVHTVVPAHCGLAGYHLAKGEYDEAIRVGTAGLALADRSGYSVWAIHRILPIMLEAAVWQGDLERAKEIRTRLRRDSEQLGHKLGMAWADACDAILVYLDGDVKRSLALLREAAERLEAIPFRPDGARMRRQLAARLRDAGDREGALAELRKVHDIFVRLGAERELDHTREQIREIGGRPPARETGTGVGGLTARETDVVKLVLDRKSNKAIAKELDISARTVSTHLSNIFRKLEVGSRGELADRARLMELGSG